MKKLLLAAGLMLTAVGGVVMASSSSDVIAVQEVCAPLDSGKIDTSGDPLTVTITAPAGNLITGYCVKAGSDVSVPDGAVVNVNVDPPQSSVTFGHPSGKAVSHYSFSYEPILISTSTTTVPASTTTTVPASTTTTTTSTTTTTTSTTTSTTTAPTTTTVPDVPTTAVPTTQPTAVAGDGGTVPTTVTPVVAGETGTVPDKLPRTGPSQTTGMAIMALGLLLTGFAVVAMTRRPEDEPLI